MPALTERAAIRARLERDPYWSLYALCDLEPHHFAHTSWLRPEPDQGGVALLYREFAPPIFLFVGNAPEARAVLAEARQPEVYLHVRPEVAAVAEEVYARVTTREMLRLALAPGDFQPAPGETRRLTPADLPALQRLYTSGSEKERPDFFFPAMLERGVFHGRWEDEEMVAVAGTHLFAPSVEAAAIGNVFTRPDRRGRGLGRATTSAVAAELLDRGITRLGLCQEVWTRETIRCARWNIPSAAQPDRLDFSFNESGWEVPPAQPYFDVPRVFLTDGRAISYAETVLGIVGNYRLGAIVGERTAGTNGNVNRFRLPGGYTVSWTGMKVLKHYRSPHHGIGILPTVPAPRTREGVAAGRDEVLDRGVEFLKTKLR